MKKIVCLVSCLLYLVCHTQAQTIITVAGTGVQGFTGDGGAATSAELYLPAGVTFDATGNMYIADFGNNRVREINKTTGVITTIAGTGIQGYSGDTGPAVNAELNEPIKIIFDTAGNIYIADTYNNRIRKISHATGLISTIAGTAAAGYNGDNILATSAEINQPTGLAIDSAGNIYIADEDNNRIRKISSSTGLISTVAGTGTPGYNGDNIPAINAELDSPYYVALDRHGNIYIADAGNSRIRKISVSTGLISTVAGNGTQGYNGDNILATNAELFVPAAVTIDSLGNIYIADFNGNRIRKISSSTGLISTIAGTGVGGYNGDDIPDTSAQLNNPNDVTFDSAGNLYIADATNNRVREITGLTGIKEQNRGMFWCNLYPNPNNGNMTLQYSISQSDKGELDIYDFTGRKINSYSLNASSNTMNISESNLSNGIYFYRITVNNVIAKTDKLIIIK